MKESKTSPHTGNLVPSEHGLASERSFLLAKLEQVLLELGVPHSAEEIFGGLLEDPASFEKDKQILIGRLRETVCTNEVVSTPAGRYTILSYITAFDVCQGFFEVADWMRTFLAEKLTPHLEEPQKETRGEIARRAFEL